MSLKIWFKTGWCFSKCKIVVFVENFVFWVQKPLFCQCFDNGLFFKRFNEKKYFLSSDFCCYGQYWPNAACASVEKKLARILDDFHIKMCFFIELYLQVGNSFVNMIYANFRIFSNLFYEIWVSKFFHEFMGIYLWGSVKKMIQKYILMCPETDLCHSTLKKCN